MQAMVAYIKFISRGVEPDQRLPGLGTGRMREVPETDDYLVTWSVTTSSRRGRAEQPRSVSDNLVARAGRVSGIAQCETLGL